MKRILALDLGIGSYGIALQERRGEGDAREYSFPVVRSCTLPGDWAELDAVRTARRMWRTRTAHKQREKWLRQVFEECGLKEAVLRGREISAAKMKQSDGTQRYELVSRGDYRLEREFPPRLGEKAKDGAASDAAGSRTVYCGAALRCLLLLGTPAQLSVQGRELEAWQIFKALHSAIQKRGYDPRVPWARQPTVVKAEEPSQAKKSASKSRSVESEEKAEVAAQSADAVEEEKENQASEARAATMKAIVEGLHADKHYQHPCFWEASQMGVWSASEPDSVLLRQTHHAHSSKWADVTDPAQALKPLGERDRYAKLPAIFPRQMVEAELMALCEAAGMLLPELAGRAHYIIYGPVGMAYPTIPRRDPAKHEEEAQRRSALAELPKAQQKKFVRGKEAEWQGSLSQKAPTFDNRGPAPCALMPEHFNVAKCDLRYKQDGSLEPESLLASEVSFLLQIKNFRFTPEVKDASAPNGLRDAFSPTELKRLFEETFTQTVIPRMQKGASGALTKKMLCDWMSPMIGPKTTPKPGLEGKGKEVIEMPKSTGRARLSRPALRLIKGLLLSGMAPAEFKAALLDPHATAFQALKEEIKLVKPSSQELNLDPMRGVTPTDLDCLDNLGASWQKISIRDERLEAFNDVSAEDKAKRQEAITRMISGEINPKIRHRLTLLDTLLEDFMQPDKLPDRVVLEFAREEWLGPKRKAELLAFQAERKDQNINARLRLGAEATHKTVLKHQLCDEQGNRCLFCGGNFSNPETTSVAHGELSFENAELAHIVADTKGGPRAYVNLVLACVGCNRAQGKLYHADAFAQKKFSLEWDAFTGIVGGLPKMRPFKKKILCTKSEDEAADMVANKTSLQETAWIAKLARVLVCLKFGWRLDAEGQERKIVIVTGSVTNRVGTKYGLYSLLGGPERQQGLAADRQAIESTLQSVETATEDELQAIGDKLPKEWKIKKRKGEASWDRGLLLWCLRRQLIANADATHEKDRSDKRHHAVDAMILSFLPHWSGNPGKSLYFGLPPGRNWKDEFSRYLSNLYPQVLVAAPPKLEQSFYGARRVGIGTAATKRYLLRDIAYTGITPKFSNSTLSKQAKRIFDAGIRKQIESFAASNPKENDWLTYCEELASQGTRGAGPRIMNVRCIVSDDLTEYADFSKDGSGAWRRGDSNQGWFICRKKGAKVGYAIEPVYVHQSKEALQKRLLAEAKYAQIVDYYVRDELVVLDQPITGILDPLPAGKFVIRSMKLDGRVVLSANTGKEYNPVSVAKLIESGFKKGNHVL
jgi:CRISPR-associated endonuclease Csn1